MEEDCIVCREPTQNQLICGHHYHTECFEVWVKGCKKNTCCICFKAIPEFEHFTKPDTEMSQTQIDEIVNNLVQILQRQPCVSPNEIDEFYMRHLLPLQYWICPKCPKMYKKKASGSLSRCALRHADNCN